MTHSDSEMHQLLKEALEGAAIDPDVMTRFDWLLWLGLLAEKKLTDLAKGVKPPETRGRPVKNEGFGIDCYRAYCIWFLEKVTPPNTFKTNRERITFMTLWAKATYPELLKAQWPVSSGSTIEQSVSRGKKKLGISKDWVNSEICSLIYQRKLEINEQEEILE